MSKAIGSHQVHIIGSGLAGSEAAFFLASRDVKVLLTEMRPVRMTPAHQTAKSAELVCSNSFKSKSQTSAPGALKRELVHAGSLILRAAEMFSVPGGEALTVDRELFSEYISESLRNHPNIQFEQKEAIRPEKNIPTIVATGPLTSDELSKWLLQVTGEDDLYFYDAIAPIIDSSSVDMGSAFLANRYGKGEEEAYLNCPLTSEEYYAFVEALRNGEKVPSKNFEKEKLYSGCQPIEAIAESGVDSLRFGPLKPVGLTNPHSSEKPFAVLQLRPENDAKTSYNLVGCQTKLKYGEQKRIFRMIPALRNAEFLRLGSVHRNTYVCAPKVLRADLSLKKNPLTYLAGQITGVEGYLESTACGLLAALFVYQRLRGERHLPPPLNTTLGSLLHHIVGSKEKNYQPSGIHFGLFHPFVFEGAAKLKKAELRAFLTEQAFKNFQNYWNTLFTSSSDKNEVHPRLQSEQIQKDIALS